MPAKATLRKSLLKTRQSLSREDWQIQSDRLCQHLSTWSVFIQAQTILTYSSFRQEPDLTPLRRQAPHKRWGLCRCMGQSLRWHEWSLDNALPLQTGAFGILEPHPDAPMLCVEQVDLILVPAVACDARGYRLGYGGGFYDRLLSAPEWQNKIAIGIVFEFARLPMLPIDPWDQPIQGVCTDAGLWMV